MFILKIENLTFEKKVRMLVTNDQGNIVMFQRAKKPGQKSTKVQLLLWFHFSEF